MTAEIHHLPLTSGAPIPPREDRDWVTSQELIADTGLTYRRVDYWTRTGLLAPLEDATPGSGYMRRYSLHQVARACGIRDLLDAGLNLITTRRVIDEFLTHGRADVGAVTITHNPTGELTA